MPSSCRELLAVDLVCLSFAQVDPALLSSALPPGSTAPALKARSHALLEARPELLKDVSSASDLKLSAMRAEDAQDLADLQEEWFPKESCRGGAPWCAELLSHEGVLAFKATIPQDETQAPVGIIVALATKQAIEELGGEATVDILRSQLTIPKYIPWDSPERRELGYVLSLGTIGELRRRGLGNALLQRALAELRAAAKASPSFLGEETKDTALRAVALHLADYNRVARTCYERAGFKMIKEEPDCYAGVGRRMHSSLLYALFIE
ncbi:unnamed protein product [Durusdinium trenchii]|uniref:N-alpha-acetyltransferase 60 n=1 Tax=Durusdinium trenchii TaxID=1381693 RepID=A0ABP0SVL2_9DINO